MYTSFQTSAKVLLSITQFIMRVIHDVDMSEIL